MITIRTSTCSVYIEGEQGGDDWDAFLDDLRADGAVVDIAEQRRIARMLGLSMWELTGVQDEHAMDMDAAAFLAECIN